MRGVPGQVKLAVELRKPLFMHCRDAGDAFSRILAQHELSAPAVVHCFTGSAQELTRFVGMGLHIGITGWVCAPCTVWAILCEIQEIRSMCAAGWAPLHIDWR